MQDRAARFRPFEPVRITLRGGNTFSSGNTRDASPGRSKRQLVQPGRLGHAESDLARSGRAGRAARRRTEKGVLRFARWSHLT